MEHYNGSNFTKLPLSDAMSFECCEYPIEICDETVSDFEISSGNRVSINIHQAHQLELEYCLSSSSIRIGILL